MNEKYIEKKKKKTGYRASFFRDKLRTKHINKCRTIKMGEGKCYQAISNANLRQITFKSSSNYFCLLKEIYLDIIYKVWDLIYYIIYYMHSQTACWMCTVNYYEDISGKRQIKLFNSSPVIAKRKLLKNAFKIS